MNQIIVQLPDIQDLAQAKKSLGTKVMLEFRLVNESDDPYKAQKSGNIPSGSKLYKDKDGKPILLKQRILLTNKYIAHALADFDPYLQQPSIIITLDKKGAKLFTKVTGTNIKKFMAIVFIEYKAGTKKLGSASLKKTITTSKVISVAKIQSELTKRFQIPGLESLEETRDLVLSINTEALAAPVYIIEEHNINSNVK